MTVPEKLALPILLDRTASRLALTSASQAEPVVSLVMERLGELMAPADRAQVAARLPDALGEWLERASAPAPADRAGFIERVASQEGVATGFALEHAQVVCGVLAEVLDDEVVALFRRRLPQWAADLVVENPRSAHTPAHRAHGGHHLADGRPGSEKPISEVAPGPAHSESVVHSDDPHGERKLSGAPGHDPETRPISESSPGSDRPLSDFHGD